MKKLFFLFYSVTILLFSCSSGGSDQSTNEAKGESGSFNFTYAEIPSKPIPVHYYYPSNSNKATCKILMVFHGDSRDASYYRDLWINYAEKYQVMVFAPEFSEKDFPGGNFYIMGNVYKDTNKPKPDELNPESQWTFSYIEPLFSEIKKRTHSTQSKYDIYGHSGGGQFAHRLVLLKSNLSINQIISSNGGWFTVADPEADFPYGLKNAPIPTSNYARLFASKLTVQVGSPCNVCNSSQSDQSAGFRHNASADAQGLNRIDRALYFFNNGKAMAQQLGLPFHWKFREVSNAYHDPVSTSLDAAQLLYE
jgi:hypothetical protein